jgi:hypothetical protein
MATTPSTQTNSPAVNTLASLSAAVPAMTAGEIADYTNTFTQCYNQVMGLFAGDTRMKIDAEVMYFVTNVQPYALFTAEGLKDASDRVFGSVEFRQMVFRLTNLFLSRLASPYTSYLQIATQLA